jgi:hypothetical protein
MDWVVIFNRLFKLLDIDGTPNYFSGPRFLRKVLEVDPYYPTYQQFINQRRTHGASTTRRDFFFDILQGLPETARVALVNSILSELDATAIDPASEIRALLGVKVSGPIAIVPSHGWNARATKPISARN